MERPDEPVYARGVPEPTSGPLFAAFGVALLFAGMVTQYAVSVVGVAAALWGAVIWWKGCFPREALEMLPEGAERIEAPSAATAAPPVEPATRHALPREVHRYSSGVVGGLVGGVAMAAVACAWGVVSHGSLWLPINLLAGVISPGVAGASEEVLESFSASWLALAAMVHIGLSISVGLLYVVSLPMMPSRPLLFGGIFGPVAMSAVAWSTMRLVDPALSARVDWSWFVASQVAFGVACGVVVSRGTKVRTMIGMSMASRFGIESAEGPER